MKKILLFFLLVSLLSLGFHNLSSQETKKDLTQEIKTEIPRKISPSYDPGGRRDPFRNLLAGRELKEKTLVGGVPQISINDINLIGIVQARGKFTAIITGPQGFPFNIKIGDKFSDGFVLSINESKVVFRQITQRGIPLMKSRDIVKEIKPEER